MSDTLAFATATELLDRLAAGTITSVALVNAMAERHAAVNPVVNAIVAFDAETALARAAEADAARARGDSLGPLHGLPMTVKDCFDAAGFATTAGSPTLKRHRPTRDAIAVERLKAAGALIVGKTNVPTFALDLQTYNPLFGTTSNPWDLARTCGGSSGGAATALAAGLTPLELGSDIGGSVRNPAHYCGVFAHKPTWGLIPSRGHVPPQPGVMMEADLQVVGPLARSAADLALMLDVLAGPAPDAWAPPVTLPAAPAGELRRFKVAVWIDDPYCPLEQAVAAQLQALLVGLDKAGVPFELRFIDGSSLEAVHDLYVPFLTAEVAGLTPDMQFLAMQAMSPWTNAMAWLGWTDTTSRSAYVNAATMSYRAHQEMEERRARLMAQALRLFDDVDVLLTPTMPWTAHPHAHAGDMLSRQLRVDGHSRRYVEGLVWIALATLLRLPATVAPLGPSANGLPGSVQIIGRPFADHTTIAFARALEAAGLAGFTPPPCCAT